tara:strand:- start:2937 stop:3545 length:609 start_codon:yes stop_codon:yes gene_type:complete
MTNIAILDYGVGNLFSIQTALNKLMVNTILTSKLNTNQEYDGIILPGVGSWKYTVKKIEENRQILQEWHDDNKPILGVCLGMQLFFQRSVEGPGKGLEFFEGEIKMLSKEVKIPHIGWNILKKNISNPLLDGVKDRAWVYFVHSLYPEPINHSIISTTTDYGIDFTSMIYDKKTFGTQFHPEKSGKAGAKILENFVSICDNQ